MERILVVEDEKPIADLVRLALTDEGYHCQCVYDGAAAADLLETTQFDLALVDIMLPGFNGFELAEYLHACEIPVIFLTACCDIADKVRGLRGGAEDYITKPFAVAELTARVATVLRRTQRNTGCLSIGDLMVNPSARTVCRSGEPVALTAKEFDLLLYFLRNPNQALRREQIYQHVWHEPYPGQSRTVDLHVQRVRKKLGLEDLLKPVYRIGYRLEMPR